MANTYQQVSLRKVRLQHSVSRTTCRCIFPKPSGTCTARGPSGLPSCCSSRRVPRRSADTRKSAFVDGRDASRSRDARSTRRAGWRTSTTPPAAASALPVSDDVGAIRMFRVVLEEYRGALSAAASSSRPRSSRDWPTQPDFVRLQTLPGIGPILALIDPGRGAGPAALRLCPAVSEVLRLRSLHGAVGAISRDDAPVQARQRPACGTPSGWRAPSPSGCSRTAFAGSLRTTSVPIRRMRTADGKATPRSPPRWRASRMPWSRTGTDYRRFPEATRPGGRIPSPGAVEAHATS